MEYILLLIVFVFAIYFIVDYKKKPNSSTSNLFYNWQYLRVVILLFGFAVALIISLFTKK